MLASMTRDDVAKIGSHFLSLQRQPSYVSKGELVGGDVGVGRGVATVLWRSGLAEVSFPWLGRSSSPPPLGKSTAIARTPFGVGPSISMLGATRRLRVTPSSWMLRGFLQPTVGNCHVTKKYGPFSVASTL